MTTCPAFVYVSDTTNNVRINLQTLQLRLWWLQWLRMTWEERASAVAILSAAGIIVRFMTKPLRATEENNTLLKVDGKIKDSETRLINEMQRLINEMQASETRLKAHNDEAIQNLRSAMDAHQAHSDEAMRNLRWDIRMGLPAASFAFLTAALAFVAAHLNSRK